jgi:hypothetical protein
MHKINDNALTLFILPYRPWNYQPVLLFQNRLESAFVQTAVWRLVGHNTGNMQHSKLHSDQLRRALMHFLRRWLQKRPGFARNSLHSNHRPLGYYYLVRLHFVERGKHHLLVGNSWRSSRMMQLADHCRLVGTPNNLDTLNFVKD